MKRTLKKTLQVRCGVNSILDCFFEHIKHKKLIFCVTKSLLMKPRKVTHPTQGKTLYSWHHSHSLHLLQYMHLITYPCGNMLEGHENWLWKLIDFHFFLGGKNNKCPYGLQAVCPFWPTKNFSPHNCRLTCFFNLFGTILCKLQKWLWCHKNPSGSAVCEIHTVTVFSTFKVTQIFPSSSPLSHGHFEI